MLCFGAFGNGMFILSVNGEMEHPFYDLFVTQYLVAIGNNGPDAIDTNYPKLMLIMFLLSSFISSVTFLNMLIGIMGSTQGRVLENQERFALIERTSIYDDFMPFVNLDKEFSGKKYMYIIEKLNTEDEDDD